MRMRTIALTWIVCLFAAADESRAQTSPPGWVVLPADEYRDLRARAGQAPAATARPEAVITRVDYALEVAGEVVLGRASLAIDVLGSGWARVALPAGLAVTEARLDQQPLVIDAGPPPVVHLSRPGRSVLDLAVVFTPTSAAGIDSLIVPASNAAITRVEIAVPGTTHVVTAKGGVVGLRSATGDRTTWTVHGRAAAPLTLSWARRRDDPRAAEPLRVRTRLEATAGLRDTLLQVATTVQLEVLQGATRTLALAVPPDATVTAVTGPAVDDWQVEAGRLRITFLEPVTQSTSCVVRVESRLSPGPEVTVPLVRAPDAEREAGWVSVDVGGEAEVLTAQTIGLDAPERHSPGADSPRARTFQLVPLSGQAARRLALTVARYTPEAVPVATVDEARYRVLASGSGPVLVEALYLVRNNQRTALTITLPTSAVLWDARVDDRRLRPGAVVAGQVLLPLDTAPAGGAPTTVVVSLVYLDRQPTWTAGTDARVVLPAVDLPIATSGVLVHHPPHLRIDVRPGAFRVTSELGPFATPMTRSADDLRPLVDDTRSGANAEALALVARLDRGRAAATRERRDGALTFPPIGPALFLRSELTAEGEGPALVLALRSSR